MQNERVTWEDLRVLLAVSREASFLAAGRTLGLSTSTVARRVSALEAHVGAQLVRRAASGATVEPGSRSLVELAERIEHELAATARDVRGAPGKLAGTVRLSIGDGFVRFVARVAASFRREHPSTFIEMVVDHRLADLPKREADLALGTGRSTSDAVVARRVGELRYGVYGSEDYLRRARHARVSRSNFPEHDFVIYEGVLEGQPEIRWLRERGAVRFPFRTNSTDGVIESAVIGQGLAALPTIIADSIPALRRIRLDEDPPSKPIILAMHRDMRSVPRVRAFADALTNEVARVLAAGTWNGRP
jgi:DNA-binding transcriptional LysR family regulator